MVLVADDVTGMVDQQRMVLKREQHRLRADDQRRQEAALLNRAHVRLPREEVPTVGVDISVGGSDSYHYLGGGVQVKSVSAAFFNAALHWPHGHF